MKILVSGAAGLVGSRFVELASKKYSLDTPSEEVLNILDGVKTKDYIKSVKADVIVHFAAFTNVSEGENQRGDKRGLCWQVNVEGTRNLLAAAGDQARFIQISTDMVFPGSSDDPGPYGESHPLPRESAKVTWYGWTKGEAERLVGEKYGDKTTILRLIYPVRAKFSGKLDYLRKPLALYDQGKLYPLFSDQQISVAFVDEIVLALEKIIDSGRTGIFHASSRDLTTPFEIVSYLIEKARGVKNAVLSATLAEQVRYPKFGGLKVEETEKRLGVRFGLWREIVDQLVEQGIT